METDQPAVTWQIDRFVQPQTREDRAEKGMKTRHTKGHVHLPEDDLSALQILFLMKTVLRSQDHINERLRSANLIESISMAAGINAL